LWLDCIRAKSIRNVLLTVETIFSGAAPLVITEEIPGLLNLLYKPWATTLSLMLPLDHHRRNPINLNGKTQREWLTMHTEEHQILRCHPAQRTGVKGRARSF
jgi:hypothetical protein